MSEQPINATPLTQGLMIAGGCSTGIFLYTSDVLPRLCVHTDDITDFYKLWTIHFEPCFGFDLLRYTCCRIPANSVFSFHYF